MLSLSDQQVALSSYRSIEENCYPMLQSKGWEVCCLIVRFVLINSRINLWWHTYMKSVWYLRKPYLYSPLALYVRIKPDLFVDRSPLIDRSHSWTMDYPICCSVLDPRILISKLKIIHHHTVYPILGYDYDLKQRPLVIYIETSWEMSKVWLVIFV